MKVLILMPDKVKQFSSALYASLRMRVGTCDAYHLNEEQWDNIENFFQRFVGKAQYDRIVIVAKPSFVLKKHKFFRQLPSLAVLRFDCDSERENMQMAKVLTRMPWIRWIGTDDEVCTDLAAHGWDAKWIPPLYDPDWFHGGATVRDKPALHLFDPANALASVLPQIALDTFRRIPADDSARYLNEHVKPQDILLFRPAGIHYQAMLVIQAMACGAVVFLPPLTLKRRVLYGWHDGEDCIFYGNSEALPELLERVWLQADLREKISRHALEKAQLFHPKEVGQRLGALLEPALRNSREYPGPRRIFGIELGW